MYLEGRGQSGGMLFFSPPPPPTAINLMAYLLGTFEIKMAAHSSKHLICTILRNTRGLWTVYLPPIFLIKGMMACNASGFCKSFFYGTGSLDLCPVLNLDDQRVTVCLVSTLQPVRHRWPLLRVQDSSQCISRGYWETDLYTFPLRISKENLIKDQSIFS